MTRDLEEYNEQIKKEGVRESIEVQIDDEHWVGYYYTNIGDTYASFTFYKGDICCPEYSEEILHTSNGDERLTESEIRKIAKERLEAFFSFRKMVQDDNII